MRNVGQYFELIEKAIEYSPATEAEPEFCQVLDEAVQLLKKEGGFAEKKRRSRKASKSKEKRND